MKFVRTRHAYMAYEDDKVGTITGVPQEVSDADAKRLTKLNEDHRDLPEFVVVDAKDADEYGFAKAATDASGEQGATLGANPGQTTPTIDNTGNVPAKSGS